MKTTVKILAIFFLFPFVFLGQDAPIKKDNLPFIIRAHVGIPKTISSSMYRQSFNGFYEGDISFNLKLTGNFYLGIGYQSTYFQNNKFLQKKVYNASVPYETRLIGDCPFVKVSYDKFVKSNVYIDYSLNYGYMLARYTSVNEDTTAYNKPYGAKTFNSHYVQPEISANFIVDRSLSFSVLLAYTTLFHKFDPNAPRFNQFEEVRLKNNNYFMSWITFGFGVNVLLGKNK